MQDPRLFISNPIVNTKEWGQQIEKYGTFWNVQSDLALELSAFQQYWPEEEGGLGPAQHLINAYKIAYPQYLPTWHNWTEERFFALSEREETTANRPRYKSVVMSGCASSAKSRDTAYYVTLWWLADPSGRTVIVLSTTGEALRRRIWNYIENAWREFPEPPGTASKHPMPKILFDKNDEVHGIHGFAIPQGTPKKTIRNMIGIHAKRGTIVVVDEAPDIEKGINDALPNLEAGQTDFQVVYLGNGDSRFNLHGLMMEPKDGWKSVNPHIHTMWPTTQQRGVCLYYSAFKSPAIFNPENIELAKFLPTAQYIHDIISDKGEDHPVVWRQVYGFPPPDDHTIKTILTPTLCDYHDLGRSVEWSGDFKLRMASLDPAFTAGGDGCILQLGDLGETVEGDIVLDYGGEKNIREIPIDASSTVPPFYQVMYKARELCEAEGIPPSLLAVDTAGTGMGLGDIFDREWSSSVVKINTNGPASQNIVEGEGQANGLILRACDLYDRHITELWFLFQLFATNNQIAGLDRATMEQFCLRTYEGKTGMSKQRLMTKKEYKLAYGQAGGNKTASPDYADAKVLLLILALRNGLRRKKAELPDDRLLQARQMYRSVLEIATRDAAKPEPLTYSQWDDSFSESDGMEVDFAETDF